jgi:threonylcarbamoyladenosine tRNA methylthiotransferase MtaB
VLAEIEQLLPKEAVINGINLSAYDYQGVNLTGLMQKLKNCSARIRLGSLEVGVITKEFLTALKEMKNFAPHFHLSLQSGSNNVLKKMNRHYTREEYVQKVDLIREYFPDAGITTDIIVGFPTETEEDFIDTVKLIERVDFSDIHPFPFSPRSGTVAYKMQDLSPEIKKQRLAVLLKIKEEQKMKFANKMVGKTLYFLPEEIKDGYLEGYSENYLRLYFKTEKPIDKVVKAKVIEPFNGGAKVEI